MINEFEEYKMFSKGLIAISAYTADKLISKYNIYFTTHPIPSFSENDFDLPVDFMVYTLDNLKSFDTQYEKIKTINFPFKSRISFFTDYKQSAVLIQKRVSEAHQVLLDRSKSVNMTNLSKVSKVSKSEVLAYMDSLDKYPTGSLFDL